MSAKTNGFAELRPGLFASTDNLRYVEKLTEGWKVDAYHRGVFGDVLARSEVIPNKEKAFQRARAA